ncbi:MAG: hypothetical protein AB7G87_03550 [Clostridia bacterium]
MSDDFNNKAEQFKDLLDNEKMADTIKMLMTMLGNNQNNNKNNSAQFNNEEHGEKTPVPIKEMSPINASSSRIPMDDTMDTIIKIKKMVDKVNSTADPRVNLLLALKPYLNNNRQTKLDTAIKVVNLTKLSSVINEIDKK